MRAIDSMVVSEEELARPPIPSGMQHGLDGVSLRSCQ
jgi:hypothetical protein